MHDARVSRVCCYISAIAMNHSIAKFIFILVLAKIDLLDSRAIEIVYSGHGCDCPKNLPYQVNVPVPPQPEEYEIRTYGYKVDTPPKTRAKYSYSFDFVVEEPIPPPQKHVQKETLYAVVDKMVLPKPDCVVESASSCATPEPEPKTCQYETTKVCTCGKCAPRKVEYVAPAYSKSCTCGKCEPSNPQCRYVFSNLPSNRILRSDRSRRDVSPKKNRFIKFLQTYVKPFKTTRDVVKSKKSKLVKRDIKGEYDLLQKDQAALDLTIPDIIQYMPETLMPDFKRGKCNIGCKNCLSKHPQDQESQPSSNKADGDTADRLKPSEQPTKGASKYAANSYDQHFLSPQFVDASYIKRSVDPYQYQYPCYSAVMPPPYMPSYAQNTGYPNWYQPRPLIDPHGHYVFDRLGHKYEVGNEGLKLVTPTSVFEGNMSAPVSTERTEVSGLPAAADAEQAQGEANASTDGGAQVPTEVPTVGAPQHLDPTYDPQMEKVIRDIIYKHPDFIDANDHPQRSVTQPQGVHSDETMQFLGKLVRGRLNNWFGINEHGPGSNLQDLNRFSRETGTSIKFLPVVTVDKEQLNRYRSQHSS